MVGAHFGVDPTFDLGEFRCRHRLEMREVEAQAIRRDQRPLLLHVGTEHIAQRRVQQMSGAVVEHAGGATRGIDCAHHPVASLQRTRLHAAGMAVELAGQLQRVATTKRTSCLSSRRIPDLATGFG